MPQIARVRPLLGSLRRRAAQPGRALLHRAFAPAAAVTAAGCVIVTAVLGILVAGHTQAGWLDRGIDGAIRSGLAGHASGLTAVAAMGSPLAVAVAAVVTFAACAWTRRFRGALLVAVAVPVASGADIGLKELFHRTLTGSLSYPSGHTTGAFALAVTFALLLTGPLRPPLPTGARGLLTGVVLALASGVAIAQVARDKHYFTDTVGGAALAGAVVLLTALALDALAAVIAARGCSDACTAGGSPGAG
jgi:membrane-associated phospholipid phosphatase